MGELKSKLPDLKELGTMAGKLFKDVKNSVGEIIRDYKEKRAKEETEKKASPNSSATTTTTTAPTKSKKTKTTAEKK